MDADLPRFNKAFRFAGLCTLWILIFPGDRTELLLRLPKWLTNPVAHDEIASELEPASECNASYCWFHRHPYNKINGFEVMKAQIDFEVMKA
jgi:hypothetical protein